MLITPSLRARPQPALHGNYSIDIDGASSVTMPRARTPATPAMPHQLHAVGHRQWLGARKVTWAEAVTNRRASRGLPASAAGDDDDRNFVKQKSGCNGRCSPFEGAAKGRALAGAAADAMVKPSGRGSAEEKQTEKETNTAIINPKSITPAAAATTSASSLKKRRGSTNSHSNPNYIRGAEVGDGDGGKRKRRRNTRTASSDSGGAAGQAVPPHRQQHQSSSLPALAARSRVRPVHCWGPGGWLSSGSSEDNGLGPGHAPPPAVPTRSPTESCNSLSTWTSDDGPRMSKMDAFEQHHAASGSILFTTEMANAAAAAIQYGAVRIRKATDFHTSLTHEHTLSPADASMYFSFSLLCPPPHPPFPSLSLPWCI